MRQNVSKSGVQTPALRKMAQAIELLEKVLGPMPDEVMRALIEEKVRHELASVEAKRREPSLN